MDLPKERLTLRPAVEDAAAGQAWLARLRHLGPEWALQVDTSQGLAVVLDQRGQDWGIKLEQARLLLREIARAA